MSEHHNPRLEEEERAARAIVDLLHQHIVDMERGCDTLGTAIALWLERHTATEEGARDGVFRANRAAKTVWFALHPTTETWR